MRVRRTFQASIVSSCQLTFLSPVTTSGNMARTRTPWPTSSSFAPFIPWQSFSRHHHKISLIQEDCQRRKSIKLSIEWPSAAGTWHRCNDTSALIKGILISCCDADDVVMSLLVFKWDVISISVLDKIFSLFQWKTIVRVTAAIGLLDYLSTSSIFLDPLLDQCLYHDDVTGHMKRMISCLDNGNNAR